MAHERKNLEEDNLKTNQSNQSVLPLFLALAILLGMVVFVGKFYSADRFAARVNVCNTVSQNLRFSCYREAMERYFGANPKDFVTRIKNTKDSELSFEGKNKNGELTYAIFGTNCHTFYHAAGDFVATHYGNRGKSIKELLGYGPTACTNGFTMGLYKRLAIQMHYDPTVLTSYWKNCIKGAENQCAHEIGHILHDKYYVSILQTIDDISKRQYGLVYPEKYGYVTMKKVNFDAPFEDCRKYIPGSKVAQCYTGVGHNLFLFSEFSKDGYKSYFQQCNQVQEKDQENCYGFFIFRIGINEGSVRFLNHDFSAGNKVCADSVNLALKNHPSFSKEDLMTHCYRGIGGGIGLFVDSEYTEVRLSQPDNSQTPVEILQYGRVCDNAISGEIDHCYEGLLGTRYSKLYQRYKIYIENVEKILPRIGNDFEIVG